MQPDGKIVIGGTSASYNDEAAASDHVMRLNADGTRDTTFNPGGVGANSTVFAVALQSDGKIVIGGTFHHLQRNASAASDHIMRLNVDGTRDATFNTTGAGTNGTVNAVAVQSGDGKILIGGSFTTYNADGVASNGIMRVNGDGTRDTGFDAGAGAGTNGTVNAIAVQADGKIRHRRDLHRIQRRRRRERQCHAAQR